MARKRPHPEVSRRKFLAGVAVAGAASAVPPAQAATTTSTSAAPRRPSALPPTMHVAAAESGTPKELSGARIGGVPGSDFMVDVIKTLNIKYLPSNPASSFRGIHESLINYGGNKMPEFLTCAHEESAVGMAHGYFKVTGKPLMTLCHGTVGLQHAAMAVYNAWCDRVPVIIVGGNDLDAAHRPPGVPTIHSAQDINALVRDFTKWDDTPVSLQHFAQSFVRAYKIAMTPPYGPVAISLDAGLQQEPMRNGEKLYIPRYVPTSPPQGDTGAVKEAARLLANAQNPVIVADRAARSENGVRLLVELAELLQAQVIDQGGRMNFPNTHYLRRPPTAVGNADVILGLELTDFWATVNAYIDNGEHGIGINTSRIKPETKLISINASELLTKANYQDFQRFQSVDVSMPADKGAIAPGKRRRWHGMRARFPRRACPWKSGRRSRIWIGRWCRYPALASTGLIGCGRWRSITVGSAHPAAMAWATARRPRSAPRSRTAISAASPSTSNPTAISCMRRACCGPPHGTRFRSWP
ncbi:MAG: hypothetical protein AUI16_12665 [Alphaproteobacteria bacterium 13_2_20CM_2_64_7]|nr:MAG: hypothetical protein AUI16_12665 [Alphaproteobacteria bacterium 13_2_20CM_2_64_7]